ncbi:aspartyl-phosphate phosphatase Spo0E family protein [Salimicrobium halophilum]|uniref:Spo0E like sporulation regulatory protein n=1 Tax=Salimicrobium halophilum TaxID=86666 RepID=A0A1G8WM31_9BACI|nr:aspartyl-phosphate phosphatase Spo0E family protein [Salimicrobium halophilum]SDJ79429.1 Spo0E like sporulation regulatory protein [Salimicrobium halophilum]
MHTSPKDILSKKIEECRKDMFRAASYQSYTSPEVVYLSRKLDGLLNEYDKWKQPASQ